MIIWDYRSILTPLMCSNIINLSSISVTVSLSISGHFTILSNHYRSKSCTIQYIRNIKDSVYIALRHLDTLPSMLMSTLSQAESTNSLTLFPNARYFFICALHSLSNGCIQSINDSQLESCNDLFSYGPVYPSPLSSLCYSLLFKWQIPGNTNMQVSLPWMCTLCGKQDEFPYTLNILDNQAYACSSICTHYI